MINAMKLKSINLIPGNHFLRIAIATALLLCIPLIASRFSSSIKWGLLDFIIAGLLLFGSGIAYELADKQLRNKRQRLIIGTMISFIFLLIWAELAVGILD